MNETTIIIKNSEIFLFSEDSSLLKGIDNALSFKDTSKAFAGGSFDKNKVKTVKFAKPLEDFNTPGLKIPIGFLKFIRETLKDYDHKEVDDRPNLETEEHIDTEIELKDVSLYEHQKDALKSAIRNRRGLVVSPTGSGKTEIFLALIKMLKEPTLVVFNRAQLTQQTTKRARDRGIDSGIVQGKNVMERNVTMATIQSIEKIENIKSYKNLIIDEVHNAGSKEFQKLLRKKHWFRIYGFSATAVNPSKIDLKTAKIMSHVGSVIFKADPKDLINKNIIAKPTIYMIPMNKPEDIEELDYRAAEKAGIIYNKHRNNVIRAITDVHANDKILIMSKYIDQGREIQKLIPEAPFIWNEIKVKERQKVVDDFENDKHRIIIASRILDEGIDIKNFNVLIIASAGATFTKTIQRLGRGLRVTDKKDSITVYDFQDNTQKNLINHSKKRIKDYKAFGYDDIRILEEW